MNLNVKIEEAVTPLEFIYSEVYSYFGHLYRDIEKLHPDGQYYPMGSEALTPNCGWVDGENPEPSFNCNKCNKNCIEYKKWEEFYSSL